MIKLTKNTVSEKKQLVKIQADSNKELLRHFYYFINYNENCVKIRNGQEIDSSCGLNYLTDWGENTSGYFRTTPADFLKTLENIELIKLLNIHNLYCEDKDIPVKLLKQSKLKAQEIYDSIEEENVLNCIDDELENL